MTELDPVLLVVLPLAVLFGVWGIWCVRGRHSRRRAFAGQVLFVASLLTLGVGSLVALHCAIRCLVPFGLSAGWLVIGMLWENPFRVKGG